MFTKIKKFTQKVYDFLLVAFYAIISVLLSVSAVFIGLGLSSNSEVLGYIGVGFAVLTFLHTVFTLVSPARRRVLFANTRSELKKVRFADAEIHSKKTKKQARKEINAEQKAERL